MAIAAKIHLCADFGANDSKLESPIKIGKKNRAAPIFSASGRLLRNNDRAQKHDRNRGCKSGHLSKLFNKRNAIDFIEGCHAAKNLPNGGFP